MENISRKQLDRICTILSNHINTKESIKLSKMLHDADVIPKLYVYTYFKKIHEEIQTLKVHSAKFDFKEFNNLIDSLPALDLHVVRNKEEACTISQILHSGFSRYDMFCDFDDSRFHDIRKSGSCECKNHGNEHWEYEFDVQNKEKKLVLIPVYHSNEDTEKYDDSPEWWCKICCDIEDDDSAVIVRCDMEMIP